MGIEEQSINVHTPKKVSDLRVWIKNLFTPKYQIITRCVDGLSGGMLYVTGKKNLKLALKEIEKSTYTNTVSIWKIKPIKDTTIKKQNWFR